MKTIITFTFIFLSTTCFADGSILAQKYKNAAESLMSVIKAGEAGSRKSEESIMQKLQGIRINVSRYTYSIDFHYDGSDCFIEGRFSHKEPTKVEPVKFYHVNCRVLDL